MTDPAHARPIDNATSRIASNPQIGASPTTNGSGNLLNGMNHFSTGGSFAQDHEHAGFCHHQKPPGITPTTDTSTVDIVAVPAVGGQSRSTWFMPDKNPHLTQVRSHESPGEISSPTVLLGRAVLNATASVQPSYQPGSPWILTDLPQEMTTARILVYSHGKPAEGSTIESLATNLLKVVLGARKNEDEKKRPLFFLSHSTGGLVVKAALIEARVNQIYDVVGANCYGVAFFATPHQGSSYISSPTYSDTIQRAMGLQWPVPRSLQRQLKIKSGILIKMARDWMPVAAELKLWTFYETIDTDLTDGNAEEHDRVSFKAPITSIKSAILELHHEVDRPVQTNHADCAAFGPDNEYTKKSFIKELSSAAKEAQKLSLLIDKNNILANLDKKIDVEVHGFYESTDQKPSDKPNPIRLWSTSNPLDIFMRDGPAKALQNRFQERTVPPTRTQMINATSSRRTSFRLTEPTADASRGAKPDQRLLGKQSSGSKFQPLQGLLTRNKGSVGSNERTARRRSLPGSSRNKTSPTLLPAVIDSSDGHGLQSSNSAHTMPSVFVSEHGNEEDFTLTPSISYSSEPRPSTRNGVNADSRGNHASVPDNSTIAGAHSSIQPPEGLSPLRIPSHASLNPVPLPPVDTQQSDDSGTESNQSDSGEVPTPGPPRRPNPESQKFVWIHLAYNNPKWVSDVFSAISRERNQSLNDVLLGNTLWCKRHIRGRNTHYHACFVKPGCILIESELKPAPYPSLPSSKAPLKAQIRMALYLPYLHWDTYTRMVKRRDIVKSRLDQGRSRPTPEDIETMDLELIVAWKYLGYDPLFHTRRTLDQFGYPNLSDTRARDDDQMLYKMTKRSPLQKGDKPSQDGKLQKASEDPAHEKDDDTSQEPKKDFYKTLIDGNVLMVDQVWLWIVDNATVVTFFPKREAISLEGKLYQQADLQTSIYNEVNADLSRRCESSLDLAALVALHSVTLLFERASHHDLEIFRIFEAAISILVENLTTSFKYFRAKGFQAVADNDDSDDDAKAIREHHKDEGKKFQTQVQQNVSALLELRDINDELLTLKKLFEQQQEAIDTMLINYDCCGHGSINGIAFLHEAQMKLKDYLHRIKEMTESAERTRADFEKLLDLIQRQANVDEARRARWQVDLQQKQSRAIFIFTVFTIFFLPLSFFTGIFGMNTSQWGGTGGQMMDLRTIGKIALPVSFVIFGSALTLALNTPIWRLVKFAVTFPFHPLEPIERGSSRSEASKSGDQEQEPKRKLRKFKKTKKCLEDYRENDFWEFNRENIEGKYEIPARNRHHEEQDDGKSGGWRRSSRKSSSGSKRKSDHDLPGKASV